MEHDVLKILIHDIIPRDRLVVQEQNRKWNGGCSKVMYNMDPNVQMSSWS